jgi:DNA-binding response OmpR family regulator
MNILVADLNKVFRTVVENFLEKRGHEVVTTFTVKDTMKHIDDGDVDIAIIDCDLRDGGGWKLCDNIEKMEQKERKNIYVIVVCSEEEGHEATHLLGKGCDDFITKPVEKNLLESRIKVAENTKRVLEAIKKPRYDAVAVLKEEHRLIRLMLEVIETIHDELDRVPDFVLEWISTTALLLDYQTHHEKEHRYMSVFIDRITEQHSDWFAELIQSSFIIIEEEHDKLEELLIDFQSEIREYFKDRDVAAEPLKKSMRRYKALLSTHVDREDEIFLPFSEKYLWDEDLVRLAEEFDDVKKKVGHADISNHILELTELVKVLRKNRLENLSLEPLTE